MTPYGYNTPEVFQMRHAERIAECELRRQAKLARESRRAAKEATGHEADKQDYRSRLRCIFSRAPQLTRFGLLAHVHRG
ncbi:MAG TPA: hypothetical protein VKX16_16600 [Chloroflexota bacterium]|nr:hypothetical protein [Chloroflexota bacterium]